jgi:hypothetical protein
MSKSAKPASQSRTGTATEVGFRPEADIASAAITAQSAAMNILRSATLVALLLGPTTIATATPGPSAQVGDTYEITKVRDTSSQRNDAASGSSHDQDTLIERIEAVRPDGFQVLFDLPQGATADERRQTWQFPARVFEPVEGPPKLLNAPELEKRVDAWLKWGNMPREACGHWIFTWNAFRIECEPRSVLEAIQAFDPKLPNLRDGALYGEAHALRPAQLTMKSSGPGGSTFVASLTLDPKAVQRERAEADVVIGEITRKPVTLEAALAERAKETVSGTIEVTIDADPAGNVRRLTKITKSQTKRSDGSLETETEMETLQRRLISSRKA